MFSKISKEEAKVIRQLATGKSHKEIAAALGKSDKTVGTQIANVSRKCEHYGNSIGLLLHFYEFKEKQ